MINDIPTETEMAISAMNRLIYNRLTDNNISKRVVKSIFDDIDTLIALSVVYAFEQQQSIVDTKLKRVCDIADECGL